MKGNLGMSLNKRRIIGLTGGIGSGKSTVADYLRAKGISVIDADKMAKSLTDKDTPIMEKIKQSFGNVFFEDGSLDRKKLAEIIFSDMDKKIILEDLITKKVVDDIIIKIDDLRKENKEGITIIDAPLLFEFGLNEIMDENWLITANMELRINRVMARDSVIPEAVISRIKAQMTDFEKAEKADIIIDNDGSLEELHKKIDVLLERLKYESN